MLPCSFSNDDDFLQLRISSATYRLPKVLLEQLPKSSLLHSLINWPLVDENANLPIKLPPGIFYNAKHNEFFASRSPAVFDCILLMLNDEPMHVPKDICPNLLGQELKFWGLPKIRFEPCCNSSRRYSCVGGLNLHTSQIYLHELASPGSGGTKGGSGALNINSNDDEDDPDESITKNFCSKIFAMFESDQDNQILDTRIRNGRQVIASISLAMILLSMVNLAVGTMPSFQFCPTNSTQSINYIISEKKSSSYDSLPFNVVLQCTGSFIFAVIDLICVVWFTLEFICRFQYSNDKLEFMSDFLNIIDLLAALPYWLELLIVVSFEDSVIENELLIGLLQFLRLARVFRVLKIARYIKDLRVLGRTVNLAKHELGTLFLFTFMGLTVFAILLYYIERDVQDSAFTSIPAASYWAIVTITTAGYGDVTPKTTLGKVIAGIACVTGILLMAMPISVLVETFGEIYTSNIWKCQDRRAESKFGRKDWLVEKRKFSSNYLYRHQRKLSTASKIIEEDAHY